MRKLLSTEALAHFSATRPWLIIAAWVIALVLAFGLIATRFGDALTSEFNPTNGPDSQRASDLIEERLRGQESVRKSVLVRSDALTVEDGAFRVLVESMQAELLALGRT